MVLRPHELRAFGVSSRGPLKLKPTRAGLTRAANLLRSGGVIAFPTDTVYGLAAAADDEVARRRIYLIKGRPVGLPLILMAAAESQLEGFVHLDGPAPRPSASPRGIGFRHGCPNRDDVFPRPRPRGSSRRRPHPEGVQAAVRNAGADRLGEPGEPRRPGGAGHAADQQVRRGL